VRPGARKSRPKLADLVGSSVWGGRKVEGDVVLPGNNRISSHNVFVETVTNRNGKEADVSQVFAFHG
jgi:hypothetical protein